MLRKIFCLCLCLFVFSCIRSSAQSFMHSVGLTPTLLLGKDEFSNNFQIFQTNITYFPRFNFIKGENSSVDVGAPVAIGFGISNTTYGDDPGFIFSYDLPAVVDYNIGCKSTPDNETYFGGYIGAGFGYSHVSVSGSSYSNFSGATYGPLVRAGVRIGSEKESWSGHGLTIGFYYKKGMEDAKLNTIGCNVLVDF